MYIEQYFSKLERIISRCQFVVSSEINFEKRSLYVGYIFGKITFVDSSQLYLMEFMDSKIRIDKFKYSYHYQTNKGRLIFRYDNARHHPELITFPHHKHISEDKVLSSTLPLLENILTEITLLIE